MTSFTGEFRFRHPVTVRFRDIDIGGHAHHSEAFMYFEEARAAYWRDVAGQASVDDIDYILAEASVRWHERVLWPQTVTVAVRVSRLGKKHWEMEYEVVGEDGALLITGTTTQVMYDYDAGAAVKIPVSIRAAMESLDGPFGPGGRPASPE
jgi:acyl-CoA thioester hydrolase